MEYVWSNTDNANILKYRGSIVLLSDFFFFGNLLIILADKMSTVFFQKCHSVCSITANLWFME